MSGQFELGQGTDHMTMLMQLSRIESMLNGITRRLESLDVIERWMKDTGAELKDLNEWTVEISGAVEEVKMGMVISE